jgi:phosphatidylethanolamine-binding protein (PEBP) family uncharacterized protein
MNIYFKNKKVNDTRILKKYTSTPPNVKLLLDKNMYYTFIMYDPNSVSSTGTWIYWVVINILDNLKTGKVLLPYYAPTPPQNTGYHHYTFLLLKQTTIISDIILSTRDMTLHDLLNQLSNNMIEISKKVFLTKYGGKLNKTRKRQLKKKI